MEMDDLKKKEEQKIFIQNEIELDNNQNIYNKEEHHDLKKKRKPQILYFLHYWINPKSMYDVFKLITPFLEKNKKNFTEDAKRQIFDLGKDSATVDTTFDKNEYSDQKISNWFYYFYFFGLVKKNNKQEIIVTEIGKEFVTSVDPTNVIELQFIKWHLPNLKSKIREDYDFWPFIFTLELTKKLDRYLTLDEIFIFVMFAQKQSQISEVIEKIIKFRRNDPELLQLRNTRRELYGYAYYYKIASTMMSYFAFTHVFTYNNERIVLTDYGANLEYHVKEFLNYRSEEYNNWFISKISIYGKKKDFQSEIGGDLNHLKINKIDQISEIKSNPILVIPGKIYLFKEASRKDIVKDLLILNVNENLDKLSDFYKTLPEIVTFCKSNNEIAKIKIPYEKNSEIQLQIYNKKRQVVRITGWRQIPELKQVSDQIEHLEPIDLELIFILKEEQSFSMNFILKNISISNSIEENYRKQLIDTFDSLRQNMPVDFQSIFKNYGIPSSDDKHILKIENMSHLYYNGLSNITIAKKKLDALIDKYRDSFCIILVHQKKQKCVILPYWIFKQQIIQAKVGEKTDKFSQNGYFTTINNDYIKWGDKILKCSEYFLAIKNLIPEPSEPTEVEIQPIFTKQQNNPDETEGSLFVTLWKKYLNSKKIFFSDEILTRVLVSLKCNKLTVFVGPSGTGKSILAEELANFLVDPGKNSYNTYYLRIAVKPNWLDTQPLLGYYNPILNKYQLTDFLKFLIQANISAEKAKSEKICAPWFIVCLDEMNLAHVELYFSDFLSAMESSNKIIRLDGIEANIQTTENGIFNLVRSSIKIPNNFKIIGTINMDETTKRLSPKVIDRAQIIPLIEVDLAQGLAADKEIEPILFQKIFDLNYRLTEACFIIGYRVWKDIINYCRIYLEYIDYTKDADLNKIKFEILDFQFEQKILPKLEGMKSKVERPLMNLILELFDKQKDPEKNTIIEPKNPQELSKWIKEGKIFSSIFSHTLEKAKKMWIRLQEDDVTSYYEF